MSAFKKSFAFGAHTVTLETGELARQAGGAVVASMGDTRVLVTAVAAKEAAKGRDFFPLTVNYVEKTYAAGRIPGGFFRREGRPSEKETLTSRLIDRPIRPLFPDGFYNDVQVVATVLSLDPEIDADIPSLLGASAALAIAGVPFNGPIGAARVGYRDGKYLLNPTAKELAASQLHLVVAGTQQAVLMVESQAAGLSEDVMLGAVVFGHTEMQIAIKAINELVKEAGKPRWDWKPAAGSAELAALVKGAAETKLREAYTITEKQARYGRVKEIKAEVTTALTAGETPKWTADQVDDQLFRLESDIVRQRILAGEPRIDGRDAVTVRPINVKVGVLPRTHGSGLFTRGETQALVVTTLGTTRDAQIIDALEGERREPFMFHYNFPPFSVGEVKFMRGASRREIGHGVLARRALLPVLPHEEDFPYTIRVVSDILESNGSSSMATVCGGSLALFDAGVPLLAPVAGVAMGLVQRGDNFAVLTDIAGQEDHYGDMDFKVAGTRKGITALQMDIKVGGVSKSVMETALEQARLGRLHILGKMEAIIGTPRHDLSNFAPRLYTLQINKEKIRDIIGPGGKTIRSIVEETGCQVEVENDGRVIIASPDAEAAKRAIQMIERLTEVPEIGKVYTGTVRRVEAYGCFVEIMPGTDGLVHISELAPYRVRETSDVVKEGDELTVKVIDIDDTGRVRLSRKAVIVEAPDYDPAVYAGMGMSEDERPPRAEGPPGGRGGDRGGRGGRPERGGRSGGGRDSRGPRR